MKLGNSLQKLVETKTNDELWNEFQAMVIDTIIRKINRNITLLIFHELYFPITISIKATKDV
jgi:hypothetical protein